VDVLTPAETSLSRRSAATVLVAGSLVAGSAAVALVVPGYARLVVGTLVAVGAALAARTLLSVLVASAPRSPPSPPADDALPSASVVVTAYNEADVLGDTVDACLALDYPADRLEVLVGYEAASTDGTAAVAEAVAAGDPRVRAIERDAPPGGKAAATNRLLDRATGEVVAVLDADQRPEPDALRRAVAWLGAERASENEGASGIGIGGGSGSRSGSGIEIGGGDGDGGDGDGDAADVWCVKGRCFGTNPRESPIALLATVERALAERAEFYARDRLGGFTLFTGGQAFFRADALRELGPFDEAVLLEDLDMAYRIARAGGEIRVDPGIVTREENPTTLRAWWHQRERWARGGMQVARRYLSPALRAGPPSATSRADFAATLSGLVALPVLLLAAPGALGAVVADAGGLPGLGPPGVAPALVAATLAAVPLAVYGVFALDRRDGYLHDAGEYVGPILLWPYFLLQTGPVIAAFLAEFVFRTPAVYVTSVGDDSGPDG
jgi:cellulose synthase/poly-beta-1,6-N-acetylglucosamine synthase-like glycosyltransferase